ncbi:hypothetical protein B296_00051226 [Ensete ventricosum]|uniref:Uncharacterized protein n=1 Tax=Ensete ventricosum TaxID=4639 RepID=A0A426X279_ENSVE|nr:hypothetical protein B296_00051226 [Ensete ventricosum]
MDGSPVSYLRGRLLEWWSSGRTPDPARRLGRVSSRRDPSDGQVSAMVDFVIPCPVKVRSVDLTFVRSAVRLLTPPILASDRLPVSGADPTERGGSGTRITERGGSGTRIWDLAERVVPGTNSGGLAERMNSGTNPRDLAERVNSGVNLGDLAERVNSGMNPGDLAERVNSGTKS